jgi:hypothetical protein
MQMDILELGLLNQIGRSVFIHCIDGQLFPTNDCVYDVCRSFRNMRTVRAASSHSSHLLLVTLILLTHKLLFPWKPTRPLSCALNRTSKPERRIVL